MASNGQTPIDISSAGDNIILTADNDRQIIYVNSFALSFFGTLPESVQFKSNSTALSGPTVCFAWVEDPRIGAPIYTTNPGESLIISLGSAIRLGGTLWITRA